MKNTSVEISDRQKQDPNFCSSYTNEFHNEKEIKLRNVHPQQICHRFKNLKKIEDEQANLGTADDADVITLSSQFDSGNMKNCT